MPGGPPPGPGGPPPAIHGPGPSATLQPQQQISQHELSGQGTKGGNLSMPQVPTPPNLQHQ